jgi:hypothetical protein
VRFQVLAEVSMRIALWECCVLSWKQTDVSGVPTAFTIREMNKPHVKISRKYSNLSDLGNFIIMYGA